MPQRTRLACTLLIAVGLVTLPAGAQQREFGDTQVFARVGLPGQPEGIALDSRGRVYVSTNNRGKGGPGPSKVFRYSPAGQLEREYVADGQNLEGDHGLLGIAFDAADRLYVMDSDPARVLRINVDSGRQETYATIPNLPACGPGVVAAGSCEPGTQDTIPWPNWPVFDAVGNLYVTDLHQATIWKIAPGGGEAVAWHQSADYQSVFSLNGIQFDRRDGSLVFVLTGAFTPGSPGRGTIYRIPIQRDGGPGLRTTVAQTLPGEGPDGLALSATGRIYVALVTSSQILVLNPDGSEAARVPDPAANRQQEIPYDAPASIAFRGTSILVTNHSYFTANPDSWAVLDMAVNETGMALHYPVIGSAGAAQPTATPTPPARGDAGGQLPASGGQSWLALTGLLLAGLAGLGGWRGRVRRAAARGQA